MPDATAPVTKKRRLQSGQACEGCRKRKHRCDGLRPRCSGCQSRGARCAYPATDVAQFSIEELESLVEARKQRISAAGVSEPTTPSSEHESLVQQELEQHLPPGDLFQSTSDTTCNDHTGLRSDKFRQQTSPSLFHNSYLPSASNIVSPASHQWGATFSSTSSRARRDPSAAREGVSGNIQTTRDSVPALPSTEPSGTDGYYGASSTFNFVTKVGSESDSQNPDASGTPTAIYESTTLPHVEPSSSDSIKETYNFPSRQLSDSLVDAYFARVHPLYPFLHESTLRAEYETFWTNLATQTPNTSWFALLNLIFAYGCEFCRADVNDNFFANAAPFVARAREIILVRVFQTADMNLVQSLLLMCHYLQGSLELNECWNLVGLTVRAGESIGLHLDPSDSPLTALEKESRKRAWWGCFIIDRTTSMKFGRPPIIKAAAAQSVALPVAVDDQYITNGTLHPRQPIGRPSKMAFFLQTITLAHVIDDILADLYLSDSEIHIPGLGKADPPTETVASAMLGNAVLLDGRLQSWWNGLPPHLKDEPPHQDDADFRRQRSVMLVRFHHIRLLVHRQPFLLFCRNRVGSGFPRAIAIASSNTCIYSACQTIEHIVTKHQHDLLNSLWYILHYVFSSVGVLLTLKMLAPDRLCLLEQLPEEGILDKGLNFLRHAGHMSPLAARYVIMLQQLRSTISGKKKALDEALQQSHDTRERAADESHAVRGSSQMMADVPSLLPNDYSTSFLDFDFDNPDDMLNGIGLPRDYFLTDWTSLGPTHGI